MNIRGILFDKDGTLLEFAKTWRPIANSVIDQVMDKFNLKEDCRQKLAAAIGLYEDHIETSGSLSAGTNKDVAMDLLSVIGHVPDREAYIKWSTETFNKTAAQLPFYPVSGIDKTIQFLKEKGVKIGLSTADTVENSRLFLEKTRIISYFDYIGADDGVINPKPATDYMEIFCRNFSLKPSEVAVAGDTMADMNFAKNSGAGLIIGVLSGTGSRQMLSAHADLVIDSVADIVNNGKIIWEDQ